jgi:hypothetical protein
VSVVLHFLALVGAIAIGAGLMWWAQRRVDAWIERRLDQW